jgi:hypothetical protein
MAGPGLPESNITRPVSHFNPLREPQVARPLFTVVTNPEYERLGK